jgi:hypothetical protein
VPGSATTPLIEEIVTTHHLKYYGSEGATPASDCDSPIPNAQIAVRGRVTAVDPAPRGRIIRGHFEFVRRDGSVPLTVDRASLRIDPNLTPPERPAKARGAEVDPRAGVTPLSQKRLEPEKVARYSDEAENLIHSDPEVARQFGFRAPIAAGLMAGNIMMEALARRAGGVPDALELFAAWNDDGIAFRGIARGQCVQPFGKAQIPLVGGNVERRMGERLRLIGHCGHDARVAVAGVVHGDPGGEVQIAAAFDVPQLGVFGLGGIDAPGRDAVCHGGGLAGPEFGVGGHDATPLICRG